MIRRTIFILAEETKIMPMSWADLSSGNPAWAKKDQFHVARKVEGLGKKLLEKMGWSEGMGLGKNAQGNAEPLVLDFKINREGLSSTNESADGPSFMGRKVNYFYDNYLIKNNLGFRRWYRKGSIW